MDQNYKGSCTDEEYANLKRLALNSDWKNIELAATVGEQQDVDLFKLFSAWQWIIPSKISQDEQLFGLITNTEALLDFVQWRLEGGVPPNIDRSDLYADFKTIRDESELQDLWRLIHCLNPISPSLIAPSHKAFSQLKPNLSSVQICYNYIAQERSVEGLYPDIHYLQKCWLYQHHDNIYIQDTSGCSKLRSIRIVSDCTQPTFLTHKNQFDHVENLYLEKVDLLRMSDEKIVFRNLTYLALHIPWISKENAIIPPNILNNIFPELKAIYITCSDYQQSLIFKAYHEKIRYGSYPGIINKDHLEWIMLDEENFPKLQTVQFYGPTLNELERREMVNVDTLHVGQIRARRRKYLDEQDFNRKVLANSPPNTVINPSSTLIKSVYLDQIKQPYNEKD